MRKNVESVVKAFKAHQKFQRERSISTDGNVIYSYAMPIAWRDEQGNVVVTDESAPSRTTSCHISGVRYAISTL